MRALYYKMHRRVQRNRRLVFAACVVFALFGWYSMASQRSSPRIELNINSKEAHDHDHAEHRNANEDEMRRHFDNSNVDIPATTTTAAAAVRKPRVNMNNYQPPEQCRQCPGEGGRPVYLDVRDRDKQNTFSILAYFRSFAHFSFRSRRLRMPRKSVLTKCSRRSSST